MGKRLTAQQIMDFYEPGDHLPSSGQSKGEFYNQRLEASKHLKVSEDKTLFEDISERGQKKPILVGSRGMGFPEILDGHHRLAVLHHINPNQFVRYRTAPK